MKYVQMKKILKDLNKKWGLDFVSATSGDCCNSCGDMMTENATKEWNEAKTFLVIKWFFKGMNYDSPFGDIEVHHIKYELPDTLSIETVCKDLDEALIGEYEVIAPENSSKCIKLKQI